MARSKEYKRSEVLDAATDHFWRVGLKHASMSDLVAKTGLNKHSMYKEFGSKEGLYAACIDNYALRVSQDLQAILQREPLGLANIEDFFENRLRYYESDDFKGCLLVDATFEAQLLPPKIREQVLLYVGQTEKLYLANLQAAKTRGELDAEADPKVMAQYIQCFIQGFIVMAQSGRSKASMRRLVGHMLNQLRSG